MVIMNNVNTTERLIHEVRERPPLWDQRNLNYHNRVVVNALWQEIANLLQVNSEYWKMNQINTTYTYLILKYPQLPEFPKFLLQ